MFKVVKALIRFRFRLGLWQIKAWHVGQRKRSSIFDGLSSVRQLKTTVDVRAITCCG